MDRVGARGLRRGGMVTARAPIDPSAVKPETLTIRGPAGMKAKLEAMAKRRRKTAPIGSEITATSLARAAVLRLIDEGDAK